uniref:UDP-glucose ceramide glucosyltransferase-like 1 n=1 Tax=Geotrypetes seraphini TaxID=260995 RepID=A0A6P8R4E4_GEOSA|nr:UDP-glucose:glycoprotein glucosyltransferase 2 isoform X2 [Geotrypetes seraphini]
MCSRLVLLLSLAFCALSVRAGANRAVKGVSASLAAKWPRTPLLLEASEFIAEEGNEKFWQFLDTVRELTVYKEGDTEHAYYNLILKKTGQFLSDLQLSLLKFAFSIGAYSPTIMMFQQIAADEPPPEGCSAFAVIHGEHTCRPNDIKRLLKNATERTKPYLYKKDHKFPTLSQDVPIVILYAEVGTKGFVKFHEVLSEKAQKGKIHYVLRHYIQNPSPRRLHLSGYGVELAIKSTEYKAVDDTQVEAPNATSVTEDDAPDEVQGFLFGKLKEIYPDLKDNLKEFRNHLIESTNNMVPLKVWELQDLSFQAASRIISSPVYDALNILRDISQNFPIKARSLTKIALNQDMRKEIKENQKNFAETLGIQPGDASLYINGLHIDLETDNLFSIMETLKMEGKMINGLHNLGIKDNDLSKFIRLQVHPVDDNYALDIRHDSIIWVNNLEMDPIYSSWPFSCQELLRPAFPGVVRQIKRNFFNLVIFIDPAQEEAVDFVKLADLFYRHHVPLRIGFVFVFNTEEVDENEDAGAALWRAYKYIAEESDTTQAFMSMTSMYSKVKDSDVLTMDHVTTVLRNQFRHSDIEAILGADSEYDKKRQMGTTFYKKTGLGPLPQALFNGVPFSSEEMDPEELETNILQKIMDATSVLQRAVFMGLLNDHMDVTDFLMEQPNVVSRISPTILGTERKHLNFASKGDKTAVIVDNMNYLRRKDEDVIYAVTIWIIADFDKAAGRQLLSNAMKHMKTSSSARLGVIHNPTAVVTEDNTVISRAILAAFLTQSNTHLRSFLNKLIKEDTTEALFSGVKIKEFFVSGMDNDAFEKKYNTIGMDTFHTHQLFCHEVLKLLPGQMAIVSNGRIIGPIEENEFHIEDLDLLEQVTFTTSADKIKAIVKKMGIDSKRGSDLVMKVDTLLSSMPKGEPRKDLKLLKEQHSVIKIDSQQNEAFYDVIAIVDPLTREAQKMAHFLIVLGKIVNMKLSLFMNCRSKLSEMPLKSFYRFVLEPELTFLPNKSLSAGPIANFLDMPESPLLTLNMITPENWLVEAVQSSCDLDNIHLQEVEGIVTANYELEYLLLEGHCFDVTTGQPPRGLQFTLGMKNEPVVVDTIVMANLGYFQLKANPGAWTLRLRKGRSEDIYHIFAHSGTDSPADQEDVIVVLNNFNSKIIKLNVQKKPDKVDEDLLSDTTTESTSVWDSIISFTGGGQTEEKEKNNVLNIFSVASGHLYERFLRIMMLSVLRNTKTPVKFWFLKNYLSPTFKEFIPHMAKKYEFQYELVQYKWPRWLHQQTEKQRIIWGYKILFLDVLFPLAVDKIIFVDADQIVRADLKELRDLNLAGAPYGYTPFCDSRRDMDGYRFWKSGYWASHLGHRKYHISALYIVDLKKFRKIAAGDRLRGQYQALSQDPNSLSNLDQDLPNNMIHQVAIKSLPQEWLWCETWCDDVSKQNAKTIDLCNNPKTKEPKLQAAMRIVPEWTEYDNEIKQLQKQVEEEKKNKIPPLSQNGLKRDEL